MTSKLYATFEHTNDFKTYPILDDWNIKRDWNKVGSLSFKSSEKLVAGTHVKLISPDHRTFAGQIVKATDKTNDYYSYDCLDYKRYLLTELSISQNNKRTSDILNLLKRHVSSPITFKITKTKNIFSNLTWESATVLEIISQLINLEFKRGTLIYFDVDENANLFYKPYPQTMKGYSLDNAISFVNSLDFADIATGYVFSVDGKVTNKHTNQSLANIWGNINVQGIFESSTSQSKSNNSDSDIKKIVADVNRSMRGYKHTYNRGTCDCICMSGKIFNKLKSNKVPCRVISYASSSARSGRHHSVQVKYKSGWRDFDYSGMDRLYKAMSTKKSQKIEREYKR